MLKGDVFAEQLFENQIFALFINTFLNGNNGVASNYKNKMAITYSGGNLTIDSGAVCIQGRFLEEATTSTINVGETNKFHKLIIEVDLDKTNTAQSFQQAYYKILSSTSNYPSVTQNNIIKNVSGIYQYELARFKTDGSGNVTDFQDKREFLDIESIYDAIETSTTALLNSIEDSADDLIADLRTELQQARDNSLYVLKGDAVYVDNTGRIQIDGNPDGVLNRATFAGTCYAVEDQTYGNLVIFTIPLPKNVLSTRTSSNTNFTINSLVGGIRAGNGDKILAKRTDLTESGNPSVLYNEVAIRDNYLILSVSFRDKRPSGDADAVDLVHEMPYFLYVNSIDISFRPI